MITYTRENGKKNLVSVGYLPNKVYLNSINHSSQDCMVKNIDICELAKNSTIQINATLPKTLGNITYISVVAERKKIINNYNVSYGLQEAADLTKFSAEMKEKQRRMVNHMVCDDKYSRLLLDYGISIIFIYTFKDGAINKVIVSSCYSFNYLVI
jgi:hypothetical protein